MEGNQSTELLQNTRGMLLSMSHLAGEEGAGGSVEAGGMEGSNHRAAGEEAREDKRSAAVMLPLCVIG